MIAVDRDVCGGDVVVGHFVYQEKVRVPWRLPLWQFAGCGRKQ